MNHPLFTARSANWPDDIPALRLVRTRVFINEQKVPETLEWDNDDPIALHFLAEDESGQPIGTARLLQTGQIGRMAVLKKWRGRGVGNALLSRVLAQITLDQYPSPFLNAQVQVVGFYSRFGFVPQGEPFSEAGILHQRMEILCVSSS